MKKLIFIAFILLSVQLTYSNSNFDTIIAHPQDERINDLVEFANFYILSGSILDSNCSYSYVIKINKQGLFIKDTIFDCSSISQRIFRVDNEIVLFRSGVFDSLGQSCFIYTRMDTSFNILFEKKLLMPSGLYPFRYNVIMNSDSNFIIAATSNVVTSTPWILNVFLYNVSLMGDSVSSIFMNGTSSPMRICYDAVEKDLRNFAFISRLGGTTAIGSFLIVDTNLNISDTVNIPDELYDNFSPKLINDSLFVICTRKLSYDDIYITIINESGQIIKSRSFNKNNSLAWPAYQNSLSISSNHIYFLVNTDFCMASPFFGIGAPSSIMVGKLDLELDTIWLQFLGGDYYYHAYNIRATSDGGCILIGTLNDTINHNNNRNFFIIKLDSNGSTTWSQNIRLSKPDIKVFPNPVTDYLNIKINTLNDPIHNITIYNIQGKEILKKQINTFQTRINVSSMSKGIYIVEGITHSGAIFREKFVKE